MKKFLSAMLLLLVILGVSGCVKYDYVMIQPNEDGYAIATTGDSLNNQSMFSSVDFLKENKVAAKDYRIDYERKQVGTLERVWRPKHLLIIVDKSPTTREWTESVSSGTSNQNEGIISESIESISFMARMNCSAYIFDSALYLHSFQNKNLEKNSAVMRVNLADIMDKQIRPKVESTFIEVTSSMTMAEIIKSKKTIMESVRLEVVDFFRKKGIEITVLGFKGDFEYLDKNIQTAINKEFIAQKELDAQKKLNDKLIGEAEAKAKAAEIMKKDMDLQLKLQEQEIKRQFIEAWKSGGADVPSFIGGNSEFNTLFSIDTNTKK